MSNLYYMICTQLNFVFHITGCISLITLLILSHTGICNYCVILKLCLCISVLFTLIYNWISLQCFTRMYSCEERVIWTEFSRNTAVSSQGQRQLLHYLNWKYSGSWAIKIKNSYKTLSESICFLGNLKSAMWHNSFIRLLVIIMPDFYIIWCVVKDNSKSQVIVSRKIHW